MEKMGLAIFAIVVALGLVAVIALNTVMTINEVQGAKSGTGQCASFLKNASAQFCRNISSAEETDDNEETED